MNIAYFQCSSEEDLDIEWVFVSGYDPAGKTLEVNVRDRATALVKTTLTISSGLTVTGSSVRAKVSKAAMAAWAKTEYSADLVDRTGGASKRIVPTRFVFDDPGKLVGGVRGSSFQITIASNQAIITAVNGLTGPVGPATTLSIGTVTDLASGNPPTATLTGPAGAQVLNLGLVRGTPGSGAANSADILAINQQVRLERALSNAGVPDEPSLILDFLRGVHYASNTAVAAAIPVLLAAAGGASAFTRSAAATYFDSDGLMKTAAVNAPRIQFDPVTRVSRGLLLERDARTNLFSFSEQVDTAGYGKVRVSVSADAASAPDGQTTADKIVEDTSASSTHLLVKAGTVVSGSTYTLSIFVKSVERSKFQLQFDDGTATVYAGAQFDTVAGTVGGIAPAGATAGMQDCGNGWFRLWVSGVTTATVGRMVLYLRDATGAATYTGDGTSGAFTWGAQLEAGSRPSSYIPTTTSVVARTGDTFLLDLGAWLASAMGLTVSFEFSLNEHRPAPSVSTPFMISDVAVQNSVQIRSGAVLGNSFDLLTTSGSAVQIDSANYAAELVTPMRIAFGLDASGYGLAKNNALSATGGAATMPVGPTRIHLGINAFMGHVARVLIWPQRLSNAKVQSLSNPAAWS